MLPHPFYRPVVIIFLITRTQKSNKFVPKRGAGGKLQNSEAHVRHVSKHFDHNANKGGGRPMGSNRGHNAVEGKPSANTSNKEILLLSVNTACGLAIESLIVRGVGLNLCGPRPAANLL